LLRAQRVSKALNGGHYSLAYGYLSKGFDWTSIRASRCVSRLVSDGEL